MRPVNVSLGVGQEFNLGGLVKKIKVRQAIGPIVVKTPSESAPLDLGETITFEQATDQVQIINAHDAANTLELIVISSEEGALDAASSSVAINNADELANSLNAVERGLTVGEAENLYQNGFVSNIDFYFAPMAQSTVSANMIAPAYPNRWIENMTIEVYEGVVALVELPPFSDYWGGVPSTLNFTNDRDKWLDGPRYYAGERITWRREDRCGVVIGASASVTAPARIRRSLTFNERRA